jgi:hypothetical protein
MKARHARCLLAPSVRPPQARGDRLGKVAGIRRLRPMERSGGEVGVLAEFEGLKLFDTAATDALVLPRSDLWATEGSVVGELDTHGTAHGPFLASTSDLCSN